MKTVSAITSKLAPYKYYIIIALAFLAITAIYAYGTRFEKTIKVKEVNSLRSKYGTNTVADHEGNVYSVSNSIFYGVFNSIELYTKFDAEKSYQITGYGYRIPILGMFPNIVSAKQL
jgi:ssDNA-specific exonuclease RecJ